MSHIPSYCLLFSQKHINNSLHHTIFQKDCGNYPSVSYTLHNIPTRKLDCTFLGKIRFSIYLSSCFYPFSPWKIFSPWRQIQIQFQSGRGKLCGGLFFGFFFVLFSTVWVTFNPSWRPDIALVFYIFASDCDKWPQ